MRVILLLDIPGLGKMGDEKIVSDGYGRNFLIKRKLALLATSDALQQQILVRQQRAIKEEKERENAVLSKKIIEKMTMEARLKIGVRGKMFGSITQSDIHQYLIDQGVKLQKQAIMLKEPIKQIGEHEVAVILHPEIRAILKIKIDPLKE